MNEVVIKTFSEQETVAFGEWLGQRVVNHLFIALSGDLGAGKTHFVQGLAKGMGIDEIVTSPTFTILNCYDGPLPLKHFDFYRLDREDDLYNIGWEEYSVGGVTVGVWADLFPRMIPEESIFIAIKYINETEREFHISWGEKAPLSVAKEILKYASGN